MQIDLFLGRFHPLVVHLPIGFIMLAIILELLSIWKKRNEAFHLAIQFSLLASVLASMITVVSGLLLANGGDYQADTLSQHKWMGFGVIILSFIAYIFKTKVKAYSWKVSIVAISIFLTSVSLTGHLGGILTHGDEYLVQYAPHFVKSMLGISHTETSVSLENLHPDSVLVYRDIIQPAFQQKCESCHNPDKPSGKLDLANFQDLFSKAESGHAIVSGNISASEIFKRISMPVNEKQFMPPKGKPLSYTEISILKYWIQQGADSLTQFEPSQLNPELLGLLQRDYALDYTPKPYYEKVQVDSIDNTIFDLLSDNNFQTNYLHEGNHLLDIKFSGDQINQDQIIVMEKVASNITFLNLSNSGLQNEHKIQFEQFEHLTKIDLHSNSISDQFAIKLASLRHLEIINLYNTQVSEITLEAILKIPTLKRVYIWKTNINQAVIHDYQQKYPSVMIEGGGAVSIQ